MKFKEIITLFCWLQDKGYLEEYCTCFIRNPRKLEILSYEGAIEDAFLWHKSPPGAEAWMELNRIWRTKLPDYYPYHQLKISNHTVFKVILGLTECYAHPGIIRNFIFSFTPLGGVYFPIIGEGYFFLENQKGHNGVILEELGIPYTYLRKHFPEDYAAFPIAFEGRIESAPEFLSLSGLFEFINILFEAKEGKLLIGADNPEPTRGQLAISPACGSLLKWEPRVRISEVAAFPSAMSETDAVARAPKEEPPREDPLPRINIEPSKHIKL